MAAASKFFVPHQQHRQLPDWLRKHLRYGLELSDGQTLMWFKHGTGICLTTVMLAAISTVANICGVDIVCFDCDRHGFSSPTRPEPGFHSHLFETSHSSSAILSSLKNRLWARARTRFSDVSEFGSKDYIEGEGSRGCILEREGVSSIGESDLDLSNRQRSSDLYASSSLL